MKVDFKKRGITMRESQAKQEQSGFVSFVKPVAFGIIGGLIISILLLSLISFVFTVQNIPQSAVIPFACFSICGGAFTGGFFASHKYKNKGLVLGALTGLLFFLILYIVGVFMNEINSGALAMLKLVLSVVFGSFGGIVGVNTLHKR
jgi:putative membrane protein (TIGR04086 family)